MVLPNSDQTHQWMLNLLGKLQRGTIYLQSSKVTPHKLLTNYKGKEDNFPFKKFGRHNLNQVIKLTLPKMGKLTSSASCHDKNTHYVPPDTMH